ncbi:MAG TPA: hypothetical protein PLB01_00780 [Thermoanaerobaculia bacterium]|nr:hypothetical protein [Thermoanaerobaculia bacterium]
MPTPKTSLRFPLPPALRTRTLKLLTKLDGDEDPTRHTDDLCALVLTLTESGMAHYFLKAVGDAKLGFVARQTASLGVSGAVRVMAPIVRSVLGGADAAQLRAVSRHIHGLMA